jgi:hypothetical protein
MTESREIPPICVTQPFFKSLLEKFITLSATNFWTAKFWPIAARFTNNRSKVA